MRDVCGKSFEIAFERLHNFAEFIPAYRDLAKLCCFSNGLNPIIQKSQVYAVSADSILYYTKVT